MKEKFIERNKAGEFIYNGLITDICKKYQSDSPFDKPFVGYIVMGLCAMVDASVFLNLFYIISHDSPLMIIMEVSGFLFAFDFLPVFMGIHLKRLKQKISKERFILYFALAIFLIAVFLNVFLRISTMDMIPSGSETEIIFGSAAEPDSKEESDSAALALMVFGVVLPLLTSGGSFVISYMNYNPLKIKLQNTEELIAETEDKIRRINAYLAEYEIQAKENIQMDELDRKKLYANIKYYLALSEKYRTHVVNVLKHHLKTAQSNSQLSEGNYSEKIQELEKEAAALGIDCEDLFEKEKSENEKVEDKIRRINA